MLKATSGLICQTNVWRSVYKAHVHKTTMRFHSPLSLRTNFLFPNLPNIFKINGNWGNSNYHLTLFCNSCEYIRGNFKWISKKNQVLKLRLDLKRSINYHFFLHLSFWKLAGWQNNIEYKNWNCICVNIAVLRSHGHSSSLRRFELKLMYLM